MYQRFRLDTLLPKLASAAPDSWLELRSFRGEVRRLTPTNLAAHSDLDRFLLDSQPWYSWTGGISNALTSADPDVLRQDRPVRAMLKSLQLEPDPATLPSDPAEFSFLARMIVGPADSPGEESFDITVCTAEWLAEACRKDGGIYNPRHHLVVDQDGFDQRALHAWLTARVQTIQADTWAQIGERLSRLGYWEFEGYRL